ncbi:MAG: metalloregulator ArsR/SmtB family transcription factor [Deltaproteobacteria bacterium]|nr:metalloregulator ArsR/SmtB family transcription factor [Deltaproteobacteria bacterium]
MSEKKDKTSKSTRDIFDIHSTYCGLFSNPARLRIVWILSEGAKTVGELATKLDLPVSTVSGHLRKLRDKGVVESTRDGSNIIYNTTSDHFVNGCSIIRAGIMEIIERDGRYFEGMEK